MIDYKIGFTYGLRDIFLRYRTSVIGPFWITISVSAVILGISVLYSGIFGEDFASYGPYIATGIVFWQLFSSILLDATQAYEENKSAIKYTRFSFGDAVSRLVVRNYIIFLHNLIALIGFLAFWGHFSWLVVWFPIAGALIAAALVPAAVTIYYFSARYYDLRQMVANVVQFLFFVSPIFWRPTGAVPPIVVEMNPVTTLVSVMRFPVGGVSIAYQSWISFALMFVVSTAVAFLAHHKFKSRVAEWI